MLLCLSIQAYTLLFYHHIERIWYWGLDGTEEREQIVLTLNRGIFFCHIHKYGRELYIGWDAHLNNGQWVEKKVTDGIHVTTGDLVRTNTVVPGTQPITEYDINDLNCLIEWTHGQLVQLLKEFMAEKKIDQEVDFKILRGDRQTLTGRREESRRREEPRAAPMIGRFRRAE